MPALLMLLVLLVAQSSTHAIDWSRLVPPAPPKPDEVGPLPEPSATPIVDLKQAMMGKSQSFLTRSFRNILRDDQPDREARDR